jgi:DHA2 family multidrug resistance protein
MSAGRHRILITLSIMAATVMQVLDMTIANVALPHIQGALSATQEQAAWVLTSYIVAAAIMTPPTGWLAARYGRKRVFAGAVAGFTLASVLCGAAQNLEQLVFFRILQGMCGAGLVPLSQSALLDSVPKENHGRAMALWGVGVMIGPICGPLLGGWLTELYNWRWIFYINLPFGAAALFGILSFLPETEKRHRPFDGFGFLMLSLCLGCLQMMLDRGQSLGWFDSAEIMAEACIAAVAGWMFLVHMLTAEHPFIEPGLFRDRNLTLGLGFIFVIGTILLSTVALLPPYLQHLMGYPVIDTGYALAPRGVGTMVAMMIVGRMVNRIDPRILIASGLLLTSLSLRWMAGFTLDIPLSAVVWSGVVQGLGLGFVFVPLSTIAFATLDPKYRTEGASMFSLMRNIGSSIGISAGIALLARNTQILHSTLAQSATPYNAALARVPEWSLQSPGGLMALNAEITRQASAIGFYDDFRAMMWVCLAALPLILLLRPAKRVPAPAR